MESGNIDIHTFDSIFLLFQKVKIYDLITGTHKESYRGHYSKIQCIEFEKTLSNDQCTNGVRIISGGDDKRCVCVCLCAIALS